MMIKPLVFISLYTIAGLGGWEAYTNINKDESSEKTALVEEHAIEFVSPVNKTIHRWKDHKGKWQYSDTVKTVKSYDSYAKELQLLRNLPREVLPSQALKQVTEDDGLFSSLEGLTKVSQLIGKISNLDSILGTKEEKPSEPLVKDFENLMTVYNEQKSGTTFMMGRN